jgi:uridine kinase
MSNRKALLERVALKFAGLPKAQPVVAVDGVDGAGKTTFADELELHILALGRPVIRASVDGFHNPRAIRYRRGKSNPEGFFHDSYNYSALLSCLLDPFREGRPVRTAVFNHRVDQEVTMTDIEPPARAILLIDGIFLHRDELVSNWDASIFIQVPFPVSYARMAVRDGSDPSPLDPSNRRYLEGQNIYLRMCAPSERATIVIDNSVIEAPKIVVDRSAPLG